MLVKHNWMPSNFYFNVYFQNIKIYQSLLNILKEAKEKV